MDKTSIKTFPEDSCYYCRHYSATKYGRNKGFCMRKKVSVKGKDICGYFLSEYDVKYEQEYKTPSSSW